MNRIARILQFGRINADELLTRLEQALHSLHARGSIEHFELGDSEARVQSGRGNFGMQLDIVRDRDEWRLAATPVTNPAGPFGRGEAGDEVHPMPYWVVCEKGAELKEVQRASHLEIVEWLRYRETRHPAADWLAQQLRRLAEGNRLSHEELRGIVLLGGRRFLKTLPASDRLHEMMEAAIVTLLRMQAVGNREEGILETRDFASALVGFLRETHPLEAKRATQRFMKTG